MIFFIKNSLLFVFTNVLGRGGGLQCCMLLIDKRITRNLNFLQISLRFKEAVIYNMFYNRLCQISNMMTIMLNKIKLLCFPSLLNCSFLNILAYSDHGKPSSV